MKAIHWTLLILIIVTSSLIILNTSDSTPRIEETIDLNWKFTHLDSASFSSPDFIDIDWELVSLPHDWMVTLPVHKDNPSGTAGAYYPEAIGWYRKKIDMSDYKEKNKFYLQFDGVYMNADVWVNGIHLKHHTYGYIGFNIDISDVIIKDTINVIAVRTDCSELPVDRWYSGGGIYRHVKFIATEDLHFPINSTHIQTVKKKDSWSVHATTEILNSDKRSKRFKLRTDLLAPDGSLVESKIISSSVKGNSKVTLQEIYNIDEAMQWSVENPQLYEAKCFLLSRKKIGDHVSVNFGLREASFSPDSGFILNGKKEWLKGVCLHHDGGELGAAIPDATLKYRLSALKELGVNALRLAHNPHSPELLDLCDRMGFLVINEMYDKWEQPWQKEAIDSVFASIYKDDLEYFIKRDRNHPSVIAWSVGNETIEQRKDPDTGKEWYNELSSIVEQNDSSRMVTCALHPAPSINNELPSDYIHVRPLVSYNYRTDSFAAWHEKYPDLIWLASETKAYNEQRASNYEAISYLDNSWLDMEPFIAGQFIWAGIDYLGETAGWPDRVFRNGLLKTNGEIKPYAYYTQSIYSEKPMVKIAVVDTDLVDSLNKSTSWQVKWAGAPVCRHWNFEESNTKNLKLVVYTNCDEVELSLNDSVLNKYKKADFEDGVIKDFVMFEPGMIKATASYKTSKGDIFRVTDSLVTSGKPSMIRMEPDKTNLYADGQDVVHIKTRITDSIGIQYPKANHLISYQVDGPGKIKVIDNGGMDNNTTVTNSRRVDRGSHLVIIQSTLEPGDLTISASADGLKPAQVKVRSEAIKETN